MRPLMAALIVLLAAGCVQPSEGLNSPGPSDTHQDSPLRDERNTTRAAPTVDVGVNRPFLLDVEARPEGGIAVFDLKAPPGWTGVIELAPWGDLSRIESWAILSVPKGLETFEARGMLNDMPVSIGLMGPQSAVRAPAALEPVFFGAGSFEENETFMLGVVAAGEPGAWFGLVGRMHNETSQPQEGPQDLAALVEKGTLLTPLVPPLFATGQGYHIGLYVEAAVFLFEIIVYTDDYACSRSPLLPAPATEDRAYALSLTLDVPLGPGFGILLAYADGNYGNWSAHLDVQGKVEEAQSEYLWLPEMGYVQGQELEFSGSHAGDGGMKVSFGMEEVEGSRSPTISFVTLGFGTPLPTLFGSSGPEAWGADVTLPGLGNIATLDRALGRPVPLGSLVA